MGDNLRKCPFCGGKARYVYSMPLNYVECTKCKALGATIVDAYEQRDGKKEAVEVWNRRADDGWIRVEDRLPDDDDSYLVWNGNHIFVAIYWGDGEWMFDSHATHEVTHWLPLPETPKED